MNGFSHLEIQISDSRALLVALFVLHLSAVLALVLTALPFLLCITLILLIFCSYFYTLYDLWSSPRTVIALGCCPDLRHWWLTDRLGQQYSVAAIRHYTCLPFLLILSVEDEQGRHHWVIIPRDAVEWFLFRRLSVLLLYQLPLSNPARKSSSA
ncbi:MAG: protein YgfX [Nitrincola lacisaponensis]|uniref:protein YgfX n=1 Tax=Nitrincola lacisaponensis TaxID=267850 RepID=UPI00391896A5